MAGKIHINDQTVMKWLKSDGVIAKQVALSLKASHAFDVSSWKHQELVLNYFHGNTVSKPRMPTFTCKKLLEALPGLLGGSCLCPSEEMQVLEELRPCFGNSNQETYVFDSMMQEARSVSPHTSSPPRQPGE